MSIESVNSFVEARLNDAIIPEPVSYPFNASCGVLYDCGYTTDNTVIHYHHPARGITLNPNIFNVVIRVLDGKGTQKTFGGVKGDQEKCFKVELYVLYRAFFTQLGDTPVPNVYTDEVVATKDFQNFFEKVQKAFRRCTSMKKGVNEYGGYNPELTDFSGDKSWITSRKIESSSEIADPPQPMENDTDLLFTGIIFFELTERSQDA